MASNGQNFVANKDTILKEGWFKKRNFRGEVGKSYSKRWFVLSARYIEWYDFPVRPQSRNCSLFNMFSCLFVPKHDHLAPKPHLFRLCIIQDMYFPANKGAQTELGATLELAIFDIGIPTSVGGTGRA